MRDIGLPFGVSELAEPLIGPEEADRADTAICRLHGGRIGIQLAQGDYYGRAYLCPVGRMYWRLQRHTHAMTAPLRFPRNL